MEKKTCSFALIAAVLFVLASKCVAQGTAAQVLKQQERDTLS
jgi:hypothetical protein